MLESEEHLWRACGPLHAVSPPAGLGTVWMVGPTQVNERTQAKSKVIFQRRGLDDDF